MFILIHASNCMITSGMYNRLQYLLAWGRSASSCKSQCWRVLLLVQPNAMEHVSIKLARVQYFDSKEEKHGIFREHPLCYFWSLIQVTSVLVLTSAWQFKSLKAYRYPIVAAVINSGSKWRLASVGFALLWEGTVCLALHSPARIYNCEMKVCAWIWLKSTHLLN